MSISTISNGYSQSVQFGARKKKRGLAALALAGAALLGACGQSNKTPDPQLRDSNAVVSTCKDQYFDRAKAAHFRNYPDSTHITCNKGDGGSLSRAHFEFSMPSQMSETQLKAVLEDRYDEFQALVQQDPSTIKDPLMQDSGNVVQGCGEQYSQRVIAAFNRGYAPLYITCNKGDGGSLSRSNFEFPTPDKLTKDELRSILGEELYQTYKDHPAFQTKDAVKE